MDLYLFRDAVISPCDAARDRCHRVGIAPESNGGTNGIFKRIGIKERI